MRLYYTLSELMKRFENKKFVIKSLFSGNMSNKMGYIC